LTPSSKPGTVPDASTEQRGREPRHALALGGGVSFGPSPHCEFGGRRIIRASAH
jgi:hypothetical protein